LFKAIKTPQAISTATDKLLQNNKRQP